MKSRLVVSVTIETQNPRMISDEDYVIEKRKRRTRRYATRLECVKNACEDEGSVTIFVDELYVHTITSHAAYSLCTTARRTDCYASDFFRGEPLAVQ